MLKRAYLLAIGVMTGNSLDGVDVVLTRFDQNGTIEDLASHSVDSPIELTNHLKEVRSAINGAQGKMEAAITAFDASRNGHAKFDEINQSYVSFVATAVKELIQIAKQDSKLAKYDLDAVDLIGFHGQTCAHFPPSIAKVSDPNVVYTVQIGDGQLLADLTGISVVYDFRSDDLMNGGEAAPLAPAHHQHLAQMLRSTGKFPVAFCNAGNTGNFTVISVNKDSGDLCVLGWDVGPFNNYPDKLVQMDHGERCDRDGHMGQQGKVNHDLLAKLFHTGVVTKDGENFLLVKPPKSSDPQWYKMIPELVDRGALPFADRLRTAEYFSAYIYFFGLTMIPQNIEVPCHYALCGGGWKNPVSRNHFAGLLKGDFANNPVLAEHKDLFATFLLRFGKKDVAANAVVDFSESYGFDGTAMEARIFADAAVCRIKGEAFTKPATTGVRQDTVTGIVRFPGKSQNNATANLLEWMSHFKSHDLTVDRPQVFDGRWSRACAGWHSKLSK